MGRQGHANPIILLPDPAVGEQFGAASQVWNANPFESDFVALSLLCSGNVRLIFKTLLDLPASQVNGPQLDLGNGGGTFVVLNTTQVWAASRLAGSSVTAFALPAPASSPTVGTVVEFGQGAGGPPLAVDMPVPSQGALETWVQSSAAVTATLDSLGTSAIAIPANTPTNIGPVRNVEGPIALSGAGAFDAMIRYVVPLWV